MKEKQQIEKWEKYDEAGNLPSFTLTKESNPIWFAKVYARNAKYTFTIGIRITSENLSRPKIYCSNKKWKSSTTAKKMAIDAIFKKQFIDLD